MVEVRAEGVVDAWGGGGAEVGSGAGGVAGCWDYAERLGGGGVLVRVCGWGG